MLKKFPSAKINGTKNALSFLSRVPTSHSFNFNSRFLYYLKHKVHLVCMGFSIVDSLWFLLKFIFFFKPMILNDIETDLETNFLNSEN